MRKPIVLALALASLGACMSGPPRVYDFNTIPRDRISDSMTRRFVMADKSTMAIYDLKRGATVPAHTHDSEQLTYVQQGRLRVVVRGQAFDLKAGQVIVIPPGVPHSIEALESSVEYDFFAPRRWSWAEDRDSSVQTSPPPPRGSLRP